MHADYLAMSAAAVCVTLLWLTISHGRASQPFRTGLWPVRVGVLMVLAAVLIAGGWLTHAEHVQQDRELRDRLVLLARSAAGGIDPRLLSHLGGDPDDVSTPQYAQLKHQLQRMRQSMPESRFCYVMMMRDGAVVFVADSEPADSPDLSLPGDVYEDAGEDLLRVLRTGGTAAEGPLPDEWGVWMSGLAAIADDHGRPTGMVLGVDWAAPRYDALLARARRRAIGLSAIVYLLVLGGAIGHERITLAHRALKHSEHRLALHARQTMLGLVEMDPDMRITAWNDAAANIFGYSAGEALGQHVLDLLVPEKLRPRIAGRARELFVDGRPVRSVNDNVAKDGRRITCEWSNTPLVDERGRVIGVTSMVQDISHRLAMEEQLRNAATRDQLTGLPNRALLLDRLEQAIRRHRRDPQQKFAVLFMDCDRFKVINDSLGHDVGDLMLREVGLRLTGALREVDSVSRTGSTGGVDLTAGRMGGDEFVVLLEGVRDAEAAAIVADRLLSAIAQPMHCGGHELFCTASIGLVTSDLLAERAEDVLRDADMAMYEAKLAGKGRYVIFDVSMRQRLQERHNLENDLRRAVGMLQTADAEPVAPPQFHLVYQPILDVRTGRAAQAEVLVRWHHPVRGPVSPAEFIPIAEETGLIVPLGAWILREACQSLARWRQLNPDTAPSVLSVNLSRRQLMQPELADLLLQIITRAGLTPGSIRLELTESAVMHDAEHARRVLDSLRRAGFTLALDDFGTGYSSLACLHQFPLSELKIDRSFVMNLDRGSDFGALVNAIVALAKNLGMGVVAEGVETVSQMMMLQAMGCEQIQGYFISKPMPLSDAMAFQPQEHGRDAAAA